MCCFVLNSVRNWEKERKMVALCLYLTVSTIVFGVVCCVAGTQILVLPMGSCLSSMRSIMGRERTAQAPYVENTFWLDIFLFHSWTLDLSYTSCFILMHSTLKQSTKIMAHTPWTMGNSWVCAPPRLNLFSIAQVGTRQIKSIYNQGGSASLPFHRLPNLEKWFC